MQGIRDNTFFFRFIISALETCLSFLCKGNVLALRTEITDKSRPANTLGFIEIYQTGSTILARKIIPTEAFQMIFKLILHNQFKIQSVLTKFSLDSLLTFDD